MVTFACLAVLSGVNLASGAVDTPLRALPGHHGPVFCLVFSPDGKTLATASGDVQFWNFDSGSLLRKFSNLGKQAYAVDISPDGSLFAVGTSGSTANFIPQPPKMEATIWSYSSFAVLQTIGLDKHRLQEGVKAVAFSPDNTRLAVGGSDHSHEPVKIFDVSTGARLLELSNREGVVRHLVFNKAGTLLAICRVNRVELWNITTVEKVQEFPRNRGFKVALSPDGTRLAYGLEDKSLQVMDVKTGALVVKMAGHDLGHSWGYVYSVAFSPDGAVLASGSGDATIILWRVADGRKLRTIAGHSEYVCSLAFSPDGTKLVSGADEGEVKIWDVSDVTGAKVTSSNSHLAYAKITYMLVAVGSLCFHYSGRLA